MEGVVPAVDGAVAVGGGVPAVVVTGAVDATRGLSEPPPPQALSAKAMNAAQSPAFRRLTENREVAVRGMAGVS